MTDMYKPKLVMADFEEYKKDNEICYSPHFYTHPSGYKMCMEVHASGYGVSDGTHLSAFMCLMQGDFEDQLQWPFRGDIGIKMVNQDEDKDHIIKIAKFSSGVPCQKVTTMERSHYGQGFHDFYPLAEIQSI